MPETAGDLSGIRQAAQELVPRPASATREPLSPHALVDYSFVDMDFICSLQAFLAASLDMVES